jgi:anti-sigma regulatory factor (Ser/Thr protein kinase)
MVPIVTAPFGRMTVRRALPPDALAPAVARAALRRLRMEEDVLERGELVISEVVTNAVRHANLTLSQPIRVVLALVPRMLRIEVTDDGEGFDPVVEPPLDQDPDEGGWGLFLVEQLADRWGVDQGPPTTVWFELGA